MLEINDLVGVVFSGLSDLVIEEVADENDLIRVMARTRDEPVPCPVCGVLTGRVHGFCSRTVTDVPIDGRAVVLSVTVRRLVCPALGCPRQTFREQVPGLHGQGLSVAYLSRGKREAAPFRERRSHYNGHRPHQSRCQRPPDIATQPSHDVTDLDDLRSIRRKPVVQA